MQNGFAVFVEKMLKQGNDIEGFDEAKAVFDKMPKTIAEIEEQQSKIHSGYLMRGALFHGGWIEEMPYNAAMEHFLKSNCNFPFFSPSEQFSHLIGRYIGLLSMLYLNRTLESVAKNKPLPLRVPSMNEGQQKQTRKRIEARCSSGKWPANSIIVYHFGDPIVNARAAFHFLAWHHKASTAFPNFFANEHLKSIASWQNKKEGFYVMEIPAEDWQGGIGRLTAGKSTEEARQHLKDGWHFMGWEGIQLFAIFPYYPLLMDIPLMIPKLILPGLEVRQHHNSASWLVPTVDFSAEETELQFGIKNKKDKSPLYGIGLVRCLGPLEDFI